MDSPTLDATVLDRVAVLARVHVEPEERARLLAQMAEILGYVEQLSVVPIAAEPPDRGAVALREDLPRPAENPVTRVAVPRVVDTDSPEGA